MNSQQYAVCRKCGDPIVRDHPRAMWCSLRSQPWPHSCPRPWWRFGIDHVPGDDIITGEAAQLALTAYLASGQRTQRRPREWRARRVWVRG